MRQLTCSRAGLLGILGLVVSPVLAAQPSVEIRDPWVRATVPGQEVAAAYAEFVASRPLRLTAISSPLARSGALHEMKEEGGVMRMRNRRDFALPAGRSVKLAPGGLHIMLFGVSGPLEAGRQVPLRFEFRGSDGRTFSRTVEATVRAVESD
ncbi:MAG: copper chaperone PCu(A)C [Betaproteobacteria bacterium]|jgi:hypothetical protein